MSTLVLPSPHLLERLGTGKLTPRRVTIAWIPPRVGSQSRLRLRKCPFQSRLLFLTTTAWEELRNSLPEQKTENEPPSPSVIFNTCVTQSLRTARNHASLCGGRAEYGDVPNHHDALSCGEQRRRMSRTRSRSLTATNGGACFTPTSTRRCSHCTNAR